MDDSADTIFAQCLPAVDVPFESIWMDVGVPSKDVFPDLLTDGDVLGLLEGYRQ